MTYTAVNDTVVEIHDKAELYVTSESVLNRPSMKNNNNNLGIY